MKDNNASAKQVIKSIRSATDIASMPSPGDIEEAIIAAREAGDFGLMSKIQQALQETLERIKADQVAKFSAAHAGASEAKSPLDKAKEYFADKDVIKSEATANRVASGEPASIGDVLHMVEHHCSEKARDKVASISSGIDNEVIAIYKGAAQKGEDKLSVEDAAHVKELLDKRVMLEKRSVLDHAITQEIGNNHTPKSREKAVKANIDGVNYAVIKAKTTEKKVAAIHGDISLNLNTMLSNPGKKDFETVLSNAKKEMESLKQSIGVSKAPEQTREAAPHGAGLTSTYDQEKFKAATEVEYIDPSKPRSPSATPTVSRAQGKGKQK